MLNLGRWPGLDSFVTAASLSPVKASQADSRVFSPVAAPFSCLPRQETRGKQKELSIESSELPPRSHPGARCSPPGGGVLFGSWVSCLARRRTTLNHPSVFLCPSLIKVPSNQMSIFLCIYLKYFYPPPFSLRKDPRWYLWLSIPKL